MQTIDRVKALKNELTIKELARMVDVAIKGDGLAYYPNSYAMTQGYPYAMLQLLPKSGKGLFEVFDNVDTRHVSLLLDLGTIIGLSQALQ